MQKQIEDGENLLEREHVAFGRRRVRREIHRIEGSFFIVAISDCENGFVTVRRFVVRVVQDFREFREEERRPEEGPERDEG